LRIKQEETWMIKIYHKIQAGLQDTNFQYFCLYWNYAHVGMIKHVKK
jgi:hypothetical protein